MVTTRKGKKKAKKSDNDSESSGRSVGSHSDIVLETEDASVTTNKSAKSTKSEQKVRYCPHHLLHSFPCQPVSQPSLSLVSLFLLANQTCSERREILVGVYRRIRRPSLERNPRFPQVLAVLGREVSFVGLVRRASASLWTSKFFFA